MAKILIQPATDEYLDLVREFPLRKIRTSGEHADALRVSGRLVGLVRKLSRAQSEYLDALVTLIQAFENGQMGPPKRSAAPIDALNHLMDSNHMKQRELAELLGVSESAVSMILSGKRELTKSHIIRLAERFCVSVELFF